MERIITTVRCLAVGLALLSSTASAKEPRTKVILNGKLIGVTFNDGDSFRVLSGGDDGSKARLAGYNTPESYGAVHSWGTWTERELFVIAKMATKFGQRGVWDCESDGKTDTYGRTLVHCPALSEELVRRGLAHALSVNDKPSSPELIAAQREAQEARRGMWAHGVPAFILTSLHSAEEDVDGHGTYNRLVSTTDGHSVKWRHENRYDECEKVCHLVYEVDAAKIDEVAATLKDDATIGSLVAGLSEEALRGLVADFAHYRHVNRSIPEKERENVHARLAAIAAEGRFGNTEGKPDSCMIHVPFDRRFGTGRAACLK